MRLPGAVLLACAAAVGQEGPAARERLVQDIDTVARSLLAGGPPAVLSIAVASRDPATGMEWSWAAGHGAEDAGGTRPATGATVFRAGAVGSMVTAAAFLALVDQGRIESGATGEAWDPVRAAAAVAGVQGTSFEQAVQDLVLERLGLRDMGFDDRADLAARTAPGHLRGWDGAIVTDPGHRHAVVPHLNLRASPADLARFGASWFSQPERPVWRPGTGERQLGCTASWFEGRLRLGQRGAVHGAALAEAQATLEPRGSATELPLPRPRTPHRALGLREPTRPEPRKVRRTGAQVQVGNDCMAVTRVGDDGTVPATQVTRRSACREVGAVVEAHVAEAKALEHQILHGLLERRTLHAGNGSGGAHRVPRLTRGTGLDPALVHQREECRSRHHRADRTGAEHGGSRCRPRSACVLGAMTGCP